jgi:hypothetical protein
MGGGARPALARLYRLWEDSGACAMCGTYQGCHREWDSIDAFQRLYSRSHALRAIRLEWPDYTRHQVRAVRDAYAEARRLHRPLPGREAR